MQCKNETVVGKLGEGGFGVATLVIRNGKKMVKKEATHEGWRLKQEAEVLKILGKHAGIIELVEYTDNRLYIEYGGITLFDLVFEISEDKIVDIYKQLLNALKHMHSKGMYHRDLKLENIVVNIETGIMKLIDFGMATMNTTSSTRCGSHTYTAPEVLTVGLDGVYNCATADIWSFGVILFSMIYKFFPLKTASLHDDTMQKYCNFVRGYNMTPMSALKRLWGANKVITHGHNSKLGDVYTQIDRALLPDATCRKIMEHKPLKSPKCQTINGFVVPLVEVV